MNDKVDIEIYRRKLIVEIEGMTPIEINAVAQKVDERMQQLAHETKVADSSKLGILAALHFAIELEKLASVQDTQNRALEHKVDELTVALQSALAATHK